MKKIFVIVTFLIFCTFQVYGEPLKENSFVRVLIGNKKPNSNSLQQVKKVKAKAIVDGSKYEGEIEIWKGEEGYFIVNVVTLQDYVKGVVASEVGPQWPLEALKAQAVLARTYVVSHILRNREKNFYDVTSSVFHQVYREDGITPEVEKAVKETEGQILTYNGKPIMAFYHACSVTSTEDPEEVFGSSLPYLKPVKVPLTLSPYTYWEKKIPFSVLERTLSIKNIKEVRILSYTKTERVKELEFIGDNGKKIIKTTELRRLLDWVVLPSTMIKSIKVEKDGVVFEGQGYGHGVGMCQWCAFQMAQEGKNYIEILKYFYPNTEISNLHGDN